LQQYHFAKNLQSQTVIREKLHKTLLYKKAVCKMLLKSTPVDNFSNNLFATFALISLGKKLYSQTLIREKLHITLFPVKIWS
jgi:hypothetical protein